jgi:hypothetical protein
VCAEQENQQEHLESFFTGKEIVGRCMGGLLIQLFQVKTDLT